MASKNPLHNDLHRRTHTHARPKPHSCCFNQSLRRANYGTQESILVCCNIHVGWSRVFTNGMSFSGFNGCDSHNIHRGVIRSLIFCNPDRTTPYTSVHFCPLLRMRTGCGASLSSHIGRSDLLKRTGRDRSLFVYSTTHSQ